jgi:hypothetical protein
LCENLFSVKQYLWARFVRKSLAKSLQDQKNGFQSVTVLKQSRTLMKYEFY